MLLHGTCRVQITEWGRKVRALKKSVLTAGVALPLLGGTVAAADVSQASAAATQPATWGPWIFQGPFSTFLACDDRWATVDGPGVQATPCQWDSQLKGWDFAYRVQNSVGT